MKAAESSDDMKRVSTVAPTVKATLAERRLWLAL
jgi:hypothetical protein